MWLPFRIQQAFEALQRDAAMDLRLQAIACQEASRGSLSKALVLLALVIGFRPGTRSCKKEPMTRARCHELARRTEGRLVVVRVVDPSQGCKEEKKAGAVLNDGHFET